MIRHKGNPLFQKYVIDHQYTDYITAQEGGDFAVREGCELLLGLAGIHDETITERLNFHPHYGRYLSERQDIESMFFTLTGGQFEQQVL